MRLFVALQPPVDVVEDLGEFLEPRRDVEGPRWSSPDGWHVTLAFAGAVPERVVEPLLDGVAAVAAGRAPVGLTVTGGGCFPDVARAKVLWAGVSDGGALAPLAAAVRSAVAVVGGAPDGGPFVPHVTLGRFGRAVDATRWVRVLDTYRGPSWVADEVVVVQSHLPRERGHRPRHEVLARCPLGG
ncbi:RNA 2',3'-cyclic phosphodiesterase [Phycicoccus sonneratiae]|uniref:RNA 2',3'-cyclic phosphodiesterase n=1 Tax=Phycicoccus sonneratiae TaxID=2807628 RepID=A0ABS2CGW4_9MICO|nr:RNA 2',3'-cyclic phosphodiesterase [Phycicoccus sonneraticus]MBM6399112.1 RNA 2',3'-cyclic phosphodiesterase [Phycicoccus sonneraticus]